MSVGSGDQQSQVTSRISSGDGEKLTIMDSGAVIKEKGIPEWKA